MKKENLETFETVTHRYLTNRKGITLIALIITILVMVILAAVVINTVVGEKGAITQAEKSGTVMEKSEIYEKIATAIDYNNNGKINLPQTKENILNIFGQDASIEEIIDEETNELTELKVKIQGKYDAYEYKITGSGIEIIEDDEIIQSLWKQIDKPDTWTSEKVTAMSDEAGNLIPLPQGYQISKKIEEQTIENGVVITDGVNEFVWIPTTGFTQSYNYKKDAYTKYSEPTTLTSNYGNENYDSQSVLNQKYGNGFFTYSESEGSFAYSRHYNELYNSVKTYGGFYIGRYETTIDGENIGSKYGSQVINGNMKISQTNNQYVLWWGLYYLQRNSNVLGNGDYVQTNMIWGQQWDKMISCFDKYNCIYDGASRGSSIPRQYKEAGNSEYKLNDEIKKDIVYNIYDVRGNYAEWTAEAASERDKRILRRVDYYDNGDEIDIRKIYSAGSNNQNRK